MELKISCDASVKLKRMNGIKTVDCSVNDYEKNKDTLSGNIKIEGKYIKDNLDEEYDFSELVPFTVVFRDENFELNNITCENFNFNQIVNQGLECHFDILLDYTKQGIEEETSEIEDDLDIFTEPDEDMIKEAEDVEEDEKISEKYDEMLKDILQKRDDNFLEENESEDVLADIDEDKLVVESKSSCEECIQEEERFTESEEVLNESEETVSNESEEYLNEVEEIPIELESQELPVEVDCKKATKIGINVTGNLDKKETINPFSKTLKEKYDNYKIYYINKESEVDQICQQENININDVFEEFNKHKRIIIK